MAHKSIKSLFLVSQTIRSKLMITIPLKNSMIQRMLWWEMTQSIWKMKNWTHLDRVLWQRRMPRKSNRALRRARDYSVWIRRVMSMPLWSLIKMELISMVAIPWTTTLSIVKSSKSLPWVGSRSANTKQLLMNNIILAVWKSRCRIGIQAEEIQPALAESTGSSQVFMRQLTLVYFKIKMIHRTPSCLRDRTMLPWTSDKMITKPHWGSRELTTM